MAPTAPTPAFNIPGIIGLAMVTPAAIFSPLSFLGIPFLILAPVGCIGLVMCAVGALFKPRWPAVAGLVIGIGTLIFWFGFFVYAFVSSLP